jgi:hypothetical protein
VVDSENLAKLLGHLAPATFWRFMRAHLDGDLPSLEPSQSVRAQRQELGQIVTGQALAQRQRLEEQAEHIVLLTDIAGQKVLCGFRSALAAPQRLVFDAQPNQHERACWLHHEAPALFHAALNARLADVLRQSAVCYAGFVVGKGMAVPTHAQAQRQFQEALAQHLGLAVQEVAVEIFTRLQPQAQHASEVALYQICIHHNCPAVLMDHVECGVLVSARVVQCVTTYVTYEPAQGYLEVLSKNSAGRDALACLVAHHLLLAPAGKVRLGVKQYNYQSLAVARHFDISGENVAMVKVTELGYVSHTNRMLLLKTWVKDMDDLYTAAKSMVGPDFSFADHTLVYAKLSIELLKVGQEQPRTISVILRDNNKCNIKTQREKDRALCDRLLAKWQLVKEIFYDDLAPDNACPA